MGASESTQVPDSVPLGRGLVAHIDKFCRLGAGGYGVVYGGHLSPSGQSVAVKVVHRHHSLPACEDEGLNETEAAEANLGYRHGRNDFWGDPEGTTEAGKTVNAQHASDLDEKHHEHVEHVNQTEQQSGAPPEENREAGTKFEKSNDGDIYTDMPRRLSSKQSVTSQGSLSARSSKSSQEFVTSSTSPPKSIFESPHLLRVYGMYPCLHTGQLFTVMERLEGPPLRAYLLERYAEDLPTELEAFQIVFPVLKGLHELHEKGFIHGDIKVENLMFRHSPPNLEALTIVDVDTLLPHIPGADGLTPLLVSCPALEKQAAKENGVGNPSLSARRQPVLSQRKSRNFEGTKNPLSWAFGLSIPGDHAAASTVRNGAGQTVACSKALEEKEGKSSVTEAIKQSSVCAACGKCAGCVGYSFTPQYVPFEIFVERKISPYVDVYAVGCVLYLLMEGCFPHEPGSVASNGLLNIGATSRLGAEPVFHRAKRQYSAVCENFMRRLLHKNRKYRIADATEALQHPWIDYMAWLLEKKREDEENHQVVEGTTGEREILREEKGESAHGGNQVDRKVGETALSAATESNEAAEGFGVKTSASDSSSAVDAREEMAEIQQALHATCFEEHSSVASPNSTAAGTDSENADVWSPESSPIGTEDFVSAQQSVGHSSPVGFELFQRFPSLLTGGAHKTHDDRPTLETRCLFLSSNQAICGPLETSVEETEESFLQDEDSWQLKDPENANGATDENLKTMALDRDAPYREETKGGGSSVEANPSEAGLDGAKDGDKPDKHSEFWNEKDKKRETGEVNESVRPRPWSGCWIGFLFDAFVGKGGREVPSSHAQKDNQEGSAEVAGHSWTFPRFPRKAATVVEDQAGVDATESAAEKGADEAKKEKQTEEGNEQGEEEEESGDDVTKEARKEKIAEQQVQDDEVPTIALPPEVSRTAEGAARPDTVKKTMSEETTQEGGDRDARAAWELFQVIGLGWKLLVDTRTK
ncbi:UNVERIFIED_CONTAM: CMGC kinase, MAPK family, MEK kinase-related (incomplete catalytic triad) [Hammondia hammondi]|eukprot:XP_008886270.1 CMGC kinase, MAPK family, MEK kinase-related (incomplete catalytic triad) [Hammondia hammondi]